MTHLQLVPMGTPTGFNAKMEKLLEVQECVMLVDPKQLAKVGTMELLSDPELHRKIYEELISL